MPTSIPARIVLSDAETLLQNIDRVARWLSGGELVRSDLLTAVADLERRWAAHALSRGVILNFQVTRLAVTKVPAANPLLRRLAESAQLCPPSSQ